MRHAIRAAIRPALTILLVVCALSCGPKSVKTQFSPALVDAQGRPSLGYLEHRGEMYNLRDWSSSVYDTDDRDKAFAHSIVGPTIADDGSGFYWVTLISFPVDVDGETHIVMFEVPVEDQCVETADVDW
ncbi:MAG: hypothetical protein O7D91_02490 [Planctomycetota bacterium]|nr:hypothetical protein [Planctomycetota bacterium]